MIGFLNWHDVSHVFVVWFGVYGLALYVFTEGIDNFYK